jgi:hypothetical protein
LATGERALQLRRPPTIWTSNGPCLSEIEAPRLKTSAFRERMMRGAGCAINRNERHEPLPK